MKKFFVWAAALVCMSSCGMEIKTNADVAAAKQQELMMQEAHSELGLPAISNFQEKKLAKLIMEQRDREDLVCYAYIVSQMDGKLIYLGKCIGYGLPYSTQYTNPMKTVACHGQHGEGVEQLPQCDPNGLFMPDGLSATWLMMLDPETNEPRPVYLEPEIIVSPFKLK